MKCNGSMVCFTLLLFVLALFHCSGFNMDIFDSDSEFDVFTIKDNGASFGVDKCVVFPEFGEQSQRLSSKKRMHISYGITQLRRNTSGSELLTLVKAKLRKGAMGKFISFIDVAVGDEETGSVVFSHRQSLYKDSDIATVTPPPDKQYHNGKYFAKDTPFFFNIYLKLDLFNLRSGSMNDSVSLEPNHPYFLEVQVIQEEKQAEWMDENENKTSKAVLSCARVGSLYTGLSPSSNNPCHKNETESTIVNNIEYHSTNEYNIIMPPNGSASSVLLMYDIMLFGAVGDGGTDDTTAIEAAIGAAAVVGGKVYLPVGRYLTTRTLVIPAGVSLVGEGQGQNPRDATGLLGSVLVYRGLEYALRIVGDLVKMKDILIYDGGLSGGSAKGAVMLDAGEGRYLESIELHSLLIYRFTNGTGLTLYADAGGAVAYSSFFDVRVRSAKTGIHLHATGYGGSFVNSNSFYHGAISGGGFDYCLVLTGPGACNNNNFHGTVIEPYTSIYGHLYVSGAMSQINAQDIRIEAAQQPDSIPMVFFSKETYGSVVSGLFSAGWIDANRMAHTLNIATGKFVGASLSNTNMFPNTAFRGVVVGEATIPGWTLTSTGTSPNISVSNDRQVISDHNVLKVGIDAGVVVELKPTENPILPLGYMYRNVNFGVYVRLSSLGTTCQVYATFDTSSTNVVSSLAYTETTLSDEWTFISLAGGLPEPGGGQVSIYPRFFLHNTDAIQLLALEVTLPSFSWGQLGPQVESGPVLSSGGNVWGTLSTAVVSQVQPPDGTTGGPNYYVLPKDGNVFTFSTSLNTVLYPSMTRLNYNGNDRFHKGTVITLLFLVADVSIADSVYIDLRSGFTSTSHCSLTLMALDAGTWVELSREL